MNLADFVRRHDPDRFLTALFAPPDRRDALFTLYAFNHELARAREVVSEPPLALIRLQWWRDVIDGERAGEAAANPVAAALTETVTRFALPKALLLDLIEAHAFDLYDDPMPTFEALEGYGRQTSGAIFALAARIAGARAEHVAEQGGLAYGLTALLRSFALHASRRQFFVPLEFLEGGATPEESFAGRSSPFLIDALGMLRARARESLANFEAGLPRIPAVAMPAFLPLALVSGYLSIMDRTDYDLFRTPVEMPQWRRQWMLWWAARRWSRLMQG